MSTQADERGLAPEAAQGEQRVDRALRPRSFAAYVGQKAVVDNLQVFIAAAQQRGEPLDHMLFCGPPGLGKTTLAHLVAEALGVHLVVTSGPALERKGDLAGILTGLQRGDILFIDEIHRLNAVVEENLYPAMEDFRMDIVIGEGAHAHSVDLKLEPFTLLAATTRTGLLTGPLRDRFGWTARLVYYGVDELQQVVRRSAGALGLGIDDGGALEIARRSRGTPRIANRHLRRVRDFADVAGTGLIDTALAAHALDQLEVDAAGLDAMDRRYLETLAVQFKGGPVGVETMAAALAEPRDTLEDVYEPYLVQEGFIARTPRGRVALDRGYAHIGLVRKPNKNTAGGGADEGQGALW
jgi:Holliday junction DNA helicase RuvB